MDWNLWRCSFKENRYYYDNKKTKNFEIGKSWILCDLEATENPTLNIKFSIAVIDYLIKTL